MTATKTSKPAKDGTSAAFTLEMANESISGNIANATYLAEPAGETLISPMQQTGGSVTALSSGAITNPASVLTRPAGAVSGAVTATSATPCVFTWTGNPLVNRQTVVLAGTMPTGFSAGVAYYVVGQSGNNFSLALTLGGPGIASTSTGSGITATLTYSNGELIGSATAGGSVVAPSFAIATSAGGAILPRVRLRTNAASGWGGATLSVNLWSAAPVYASANGDGQPYNPSGAANWLANFLVGLVQFADGAAGTGGLTGANQMALKLAAGTSVFWDLQITSSLYNPNPSQTFTLIPELLN